jgi:hypothetical protein
LEYFTRAELNLILQDDARLPPIDRFRVEKIAFAVRHTFFSDQSDVQVRMLIDDLSMAFCQSRPVQHPASMNSIMMRHDIFVLVPYQSSCPDCRQVLNKSDALQRRIRLYCRNGSVVIGMSLFEWNCVHVD